MNLHGGADAFSGRDWRGSSAAIAGLSGVHTYDIVHINVHTYIHTYIHMYSQPASAKLHKQAEIGVSLSLFTLFLSLRPIQYLHPDGWRGNEMRRGGFLPVSKTNIRART